MSDAQLSKEMLIEKVGDTISLNSFPVTKLEDATTVCAKDFFSIFDSEQTTFKNIIVEGDLTISSGAGIVFENVQFNGNVKVMDGARGTTFNSCRFASLENNGVETYVINSYIQLYEPIQEYFEPLPS